MTLLEIDVRRPAEGVVHIVLTGDLDLSSSPDVIARIEQAEAEGAPVIALDLGQLTFFDSSGLRLVVAAHQRAQRDQRRFVLVRGSKIAARVLEITHLDEELEIVEDVDGLAA